MEQRLGCNNMMINAKSIKQIALTAVHLKYEKEINKILELIKNAANNGEFITYINPEKELNIKWPECSGICNVLDNLGFTSGYNKDKKSIIISWYNNLSEINLFENYTNSLNYIL